MTDKNKENLFSEQDGEHGLVVPSSAAELGKRIAEVIRILGGLNKAAPIASVSTVTLAAWRDGKSEPRFSGLSALALSSGKSLDWLAYGVEAPAPDGLSDRAMFDGPGGREKLEKAVGERLRRSRETVDAAVIAADYDPPRAIWEALRTLAHRHDLSIDDVAMILDAAKYSWPTGDDDEDAHPS